MTANAAALFINNLCAGFDLSVTTFIMNLFYPMKEFFTPFFEFISFIGHDGIPLIILSAILIIFKKTRRFGTAMLLSLAIGALITNCCLKVLIARPRPYVDTDSYFYKMWLNVGMNTESDKSFPSGHTTAAVASMMAVFLTGNRKISWTALLFGVLMGISRIYLCVHFPSDVVAGIIVGIIGGILGTLIASKLPSKFYGRDFYIYKFRQPDKTIVSGTEYNDDYKNSLKISRLTFGELGLYWKDLGKFFFTQYNYITKAFIKVVECAEDEFSQNYGYYRLILEHDDKEFANLIIDKENEAKEVLETIKTRI